MRVVVTGAGGYIGRGLVAGLVAQSRAGGAGEALDGLLTDQATADIHSALPSLPGDIADPSLQERLFSTPVDLVFHLAGVVSGAAENDFALGKRVNLDATVALLERCRLQAERSGRVARLVYTSSIAVFGTPLPMRIDDDTAPAPTLSYGAHKRACEILIDDYTRRGFVDGRAIRLSGVVVRPPLANGALSAFNSDLIREPLAGRGYVCPVSRDATVWLTSYRRTIANLLRLAEVDAAALGAARAVTAPALAVSVGDIVDAMGRVDAAAPCRVAFEPQPALEAQFGRWPLDAAFDRALALGLAADASLDALIRCHLEAAR
ncbi:MAG: NAD-dependent epimerase/dehydratase family protein [Caldimonas sp.]